MGNLQAPCCGIDDEKEKDVNTELLQSIPSNRAKTNRIASDTLESKILTCDEQSMIKDVLKQGNTDTTKYKLLFRASENNFSASRYHEICDEYSPVLVLIKNEFGHVFGGYSSINPTQKRKQNPSANPLGLKYNFFYAEDDNAFLFLLRSSNNAKVPKLYKPKPVRAYAAVFYEPSKGPCFGEGQDISIVDKCNKIRESLCRPATFNMPESNEICGGNYYGSYAGDHWKYLVDEYEVFALE